MFDERAAKKEGTITPKPGVNELYDQGIADVNSAIGSLESHLRDLKKSTGMNQLVFWGNGKDRYQVEVPMSHVNKVPSEWICKSQRKDARRFYTPTIERLFKELQDAEARVSAAQKDTLRGIFEKFDSKSLLWLHATDCVARFDALVALASVSSTPGYCWPQLHESETPVLHIVEGRHPMLDKTIIEKGDTECIPNSLSLGHLDNNQSRARVMLVSGPNMGGKSTLLRQTCLIVILAQMGCKVPAQSCRMTPVDRIFTRVGASDRILSGQSTFFVELAETASILLSATSRSLCILDELGRGTATFDGTAIAHAVVDYIVSKISCRCLFATHYHTLVDDWEMDPRVQLGHMDCVVQSDKCARGSENVTFLYKLCSGASPRSYGINVAKLAKLPVSVLESAMKYSSDYEDHIKNALVGNGCCRDFYVQFFDRLASIIGSYEKCITPAEFVYFVQEIWNRLHRRITPGDYPSSCSRT